MKRFHVNVHVHVDDLPASIALSDAPRGKPVGIPVAAAKSSSCC